MNYLYNKRNNIVRDENNGNYLLIGEGASYKLVINETGKEIYDLLCEYNDTDDILEFMSRTYPTVDVRVLKKDIYEILKCFEIYGIIDIDDIKTESSMDSQVIFNGDIYYKDVSKFIVAELQNEGIRLCADQPEYYSVLAMRGRVMQNIEKQLFLKSMGEICAYMSVSSEPVGISKVIMVREVIFKNILSENERILCFSALVNRAFRLYANQIEISKIRVSMYDANFNPELVSIIEKAGFKKSVCLNDESIYGSIHFYDFVIADNK